MVGTVLVPLETQLRQGEVRQWKYTLAEVTIACWLFVSVLNRLYTS